MKIMRNVKIYCLSHINTFANQKSLKYIKDTKKMINTKNSDKVENREKKKDYTQPLVKKIGRLNTLTKGTLGFNSDASGQANTAS